MWKPSGAFHSLSCVLGQRWIETRRYPPSEVKCLQSVSPCVPVKHTSAHSHVALNDLHFGEARVEEVGTRAALLWINSLGLHCAQVLSEGDTKCHPSSRYSAVHHWTKSISDLIKILLEFLCAHGASVSQREWLIFSAKIVLYVIFIFFLLTFVTQLKVTT